MKKRFIISLILSFASSILFGIIDSSFLLAGESSIQKYLESLSPLTLLYYLVTAGLSAALSILFATGIVIYIEKKYEIIENPFIDAFGILVGYSLVIVFYFIYKQMIKPLFNNNNNNNN